MSGAAAMMLVPIPFTEVRCLLPDRSHIALMQIGDLFGRLLGLPDFIGTEPDGKYRQPILITGEPLISGHGLLLRRWSDRGAFRANSVSLSPASTVKLLAPVGLRLGETTL